MEPSYEGNSFAVAVEVGAERRDTEFWWAVFLGGPNCFCEMVVMVFIHLSGRGCNAESSRLHVQSFVAWFIGNV